MDGQDESLVVGVQGNLDFTIHHSGDECSSFELRFILIQIPTGPQAETPMMDAATNDFAFNSPMSQRSPGMRALIADRQKLSVDVEQANHLTIDVHHLRRADRNMSCSTN
jgi:hypothetical protein